MSNERDIKRRLSSSAEVEPPAGLLEAIKQEIPEETFGPRTTPMPESGEPWRLRAVAAAVVILAAGLVAVGVSRNGPSESVQPVPEGADVATEIAVAEPEEARLKALGYIDAGDDSVVAIPRRADLGREGREQAATSFRDAPEAAPETSRDADTVRERLAERALRVEASQEPPSASVQVSPSPASPLEDSMVSAKAAGSQETVSPQAVSQEEEQSLERKSQQEAAKKVEAPAASRNAAGARSSADLLAAEADDPVDVEDEETITVRSEAPILRDLQPEPARARQVSTEDVVSETVRRRRPRRAPAAPPVPSADSSQVSEIVPGVETFEIVAENGAFHLRARLEPGFRLEIFGQEQKWIEVPQGEDRLVRYELDQTVLGALRPGRTLRLRTVVLATDGPAATFLETIPRR